MTATESVAAGVMDQEYARGRREAPHLIFRLRVRARVAVEAFLERHSRQSSYQVLDLGAAEGATLLQVRKLLNQSGRFDGVELSDTLLSEAPPLPSDTRLLKGDVTQVPEQLVAGSYDLCTVLAVLEHLVEPEACLKEAYRMLKPGGVVVASCPNPVWDEIAGRLKMVADEHHEQHLTGARVVELARQVGFDKLEYRPFMFAPVGLLPYFKLDVDPAAAVRLDRKLDAAAWLRPAFVNQLIVGQKPISV